jgi:GNAT superfamily N-acetyltransferase
MTATFKLLTVDSERIREAIRAPLAAFNARHVADGGKSFVLIPLEDAAGEVVGGLSAYTADQWLYIDLLVVPPELSGRGWGRRMVDCAEREAVRRGCHSSWLGTFEFQARGFYERLGYECFAELSDHPRGHSMYFMRKALRPTAAEVSDVKPDGPAER